MPMTLDEILASFAPTEAQRRDARNQALMAAGFGLLGTRKGREAEGIGRAGLLGLGSYNNQLYQQGQQRMDNAKLAMLMQEMQDKQAQRQAGEARAKALQEGLAGAFQGGPNLAAMGAGGPTPANAVAATPRSLAEQYRRASIVMAQAGNDEAAKRYADIANGLESEYSTTPQTMKGEGGAIKSVLIGKRGETKELPYSPAEKLHFADTGGMAGVGLDPYTGAQASAGVQKTVDPNTAYTGNITMRGQNMTDARMRDQNAISRATAAQGKSGELRKEFNALPQVKAYSEVQPVLQSVRDAMEDDTAAGDLNIIYGVAKIFDPTSVVRESETNMVVASGSPAERFLGQWNYVVKQGGRLTKEARRQLLQQVESRGRGYESGYKAARKTYEQVAARQGVDPADVFIEPFAPSASKSAPKTVNFSDLPR